MASPPATIVQQTDGKSEDSKMVLAQETTWFHQSSWTTKKTWPEYLHRTFIGFQANKDETCWKAPFLKNPGSFSELVKLVHELGKLPNWYQIPQIMACPELVGYHWRYAYNLSSEWARQNDQRLFRRIVFASIRTKRPPLCAPDFFFYDSGAKARERARLFDHRDNIPGIRWNLCLQTKRYNDHVDWPRFVEHTRSQLPTGEFLWSTSEWSTNPMDRDEHQKNTPWSTILFVRSVVEIQGYAETIRVRQEIVDFVRKHGYNISLPRRTPLKRKWSQEDRKLIVSTCNRYWVRWRENAERKLREKA
jgi:hypothetical protein